MPIRHLRVRTPNWLKAEKEYLLTDVWSSEYTSNILGGLYDEEEESQNVGLYLCQQGQFLLVKLPVKAKMESKMRFWVVEGNLFLGTDTATLTHCISKDCRMGSRIALQFKK